MDNRRSKKQIDVGGVKIGGGAPVSVQSMTNTKTTDILGTAAQINLLAGLGCDIVRVAVLDMAAADAIGEIQKLISIPLVADIHFDHRLAIRAAEAGADKLRINPGNIGGKNGVRAVAGVCSKKNIPIRLGVNGGSLSRDILERFGGVTPEALCESALGHIRLLDGFGFGDICVSVKTSSVPVTIAAYRLLHERTGYPLHLGVTEAGTGFSGLIKSSVGIGALLADGIGDTIRVSLTAQPDEEVRAGIAILKSLGLRRGYDLISCPACGRCGIDLIPIARETERRLALMESTRAGSPDGLKNITVAVMGCSVNGPGEASRADYGISGGIGEGLVFKKGEIIKKVPMDRLIDELFTIIESEDEIP